MKKNKILYIFLIIYTSLKPLFSFKSPFNSIRSDSINEYANNYSKYESLLSLIFFFAPTIYDHFDYYVMNNEAQQKTINNDQTIRINPLNFVPRIAPPNAAQEENDIEMKNIFLIMWNKIKGLNIGRKIYDAGLYELKIFNQMLTGENSISEISKRFFNTIFFRSNLSRFLITVYALPIVFGKTKIWYKNAKFHEQDAKDIFKKKNDIYKKSNDNKKKENIKKLLKNIEIEASKQKMPLITEGVSIKNIYIDLFKVQNKLEKYVDFINSGENKKEIEEELKNDLLGLNVHPVLKDTETILKYADEILNLEKNIINPNILKSTHLDLQYIKKNNKNNNNTDLNNNEESWEEYKNYLENKSKIKFPYYEYKKINEQKKKDLLF